MGTAQRYNTTMSWQQLVAALQTDMAALYATGPGTVTSVGVAAGSANLTVAGSPIVNAGTITIDLSASAKTALGLAQTALQAVPFANPSASIGLAAVNGVSTSAMRADAAPALSQAIMPTWTGAHAFAPTAGVAITATAFAGSVAMAITGASGQYAATFTGNSTSGGSRGIRVQAGTTSADFCAVFANAAGTTNMAILYGDGGFVVGSGGTDEGAGTVNATAGLYTGSTTALFSTVALANGAAAAAGTLTNAPAAGNPTKWIAINDNGTVRHIPAW